MQVADFLRLYRLDAELQTLSARLLAAYKPAEPGRPADDAARGGELRVQLRGLVGSQDAPETFRKPPRINSCAVLLTWPLASLRAWPWPASYPKFPFR